ncbi:MAG: NAD-dependent epimerase/dehydratase family protein [Candidatus Liptonbacteria bacterium]
MKIIVTGGAGFIGSHVVDAYIAAGHKVIVIDNLLTGFRKNLNKKAKFYKADIRDAAAIERIFKKERPEVVNHHAAIAEVAKSLRDPLPTLEVNVLGTANILNHFGKYGRGARRFIFASTGGAIYGEPRKLPADERIAANPLSPYGLSKKLGEDLIEYYAREHKFDYVMFRYSNVYGPRQNPRGEAGVVAIFGGLLRVGKRPVIFGDGSKTRDYVFVSDVVRANVLALKKGGGKKMNIGRGIRVSDQDIFNTVSRELNFSGRPIYKPFRKGEVKHISLDARLAKRVIGWAPRIKLRAGIRKALKK